MENLQKHPENHMVGPNPGQTVPKSKNHFVSISRREDDNGVHVNRTEYNGENGKGKVRRQKA